MRHHQRGIWRRFDTHVFWSSLIGLWLAVMPGLAASHAFWLVPFGAKPLVGERVALDLRIGPRWPGESTVRLEGLVKSFTVQDALGERVVPGRLGAAPVGHFTARAPGAALVLLQTQPSLIRLSGAEFQRYLHEEDLTAALKFRADMRVENASTREEFVRFAKTLVLVDGNSSGFNRVAQLAFELVPLTDPARYKTGDPFQVQLLRDGKAVSAIRVAALSKQQPDHIVVAHTDTNGKASLPLPTGGAWTFYAVAIAPSTHAAADWQSVWASLSFELN